MGIRSALARIFGGGPIGPRSTSSLTAKADQLRREGEALLREALLREARGLAATQPFGPRITSSLTQEMLRRYAAANLGLGKIFKVPEEKVCPLTKQLIVERLRELAIEKPYSMRRILETAFADGIADDYALLDKLEKFDKPEPELPADLKVDAVYDATQLAHRVRFRSGGKEVRAIIDDASHVTPVR